MITKNLIERRVQGQSPRSENETTFAGTVPAIQRLLDVISSILAEEYIAVAKQNSEVFLSGGKK